MRIEDARALVTGAASGLGYGFVLELARAGAAVAAGDVNADGLRRVAGEAAGVPGRVETLVADIADEAAVKAFVRDASERLGGISVLVNNAAVLLDGVLVTEEEGWVRRLPAAQWRRVLDVNLSGQFLVAREVAAEMLERGEPEGVIVNLSSLARAGNAGSPPARRPRPGSTRPPAPGAGTGAPGNPRRHSHSRGTPELRRLLTACYGAHYGVPVNPETEIVVTAQVQDRHPPGRTLEVDGGAQM